MIRPKWFVPVACVIFYRRRDSGLEFLLGKRKEKEKAEGGKWGLVGGSGAFWEGAEGIFDFAQREAVYDLLVTVKLERLKYFIDRVKREGTLLILELYFSYQLGMEQEVKVTGNDKAPDDCCWLSMEAIQAMAKEGKIAFANDEIIKLFEKQFLK